MKLDTTPGDNPYAGLPHGPILHRILQEHREAFAAKVAMLEERYIQEQTGAGCSEGEARTKFQSMIQEIARRMMREAVEAIHPRSADIP